MRRPVVAALVTAAIAVVMVWLSVNVAGTYGWALFVGVPFVIGYVTTALLAIKGPRSFASCFGTSVLAGVVLSLGFLAMGMEGLLCIAMTVPLATPLITVGAYVAYLLFHVRTPRGAMSSAMLLVAFVATAMAIEPSLHREQARIWMAEDSIEFDATEEEVWATIVDLSEIQTPDDLLFRSGIACPQKATIVQASNGGTRVCTMSTGTLLERIDRWEPGKRLAWRALNTPPPMKELNPFREADPPHLHGFYRNVRGEFEIARKGGRTRLTRRTWYEHDLYPSSYWRLWCDWGASKIHRLVLEHVRHETMRRRGGIRT